MRTYLITMLIICLSSCATFNDLQSDYITQETTRADANVEFVRAIRTGDDTWTFHVTVRHPDRGWDDYADGWDVVLPDGTVIIPNSGDTFTRVLLHPHQTEQPFTRSQSNIVIPSTITTVIVRAHDLIHGWGGQTITVNLTQPTGDGYTVEK